MLGRSSSTCRVLATTFSFSSAGGAVDASSLTVLSLVLITNRLPFISTTASESEPSVKLTFGFSPCFSFSDMQRSGRRFRNAGVISNPAAAKALPNSFRSPALSGLTWQVEHLLRSSGRDSGSAAKSLRYSGLALTVLTAMGVNITTAKKMISNLEELILDIDLSPDFSFRAEWFQGR